MRFAIHAILVCSVLFLLAGCAGQKVHVPVAQPAAQLAGKKTKSVSIARMTSHITQGTTVGEIKHGLPPIIPAGELTWEGGMGHDFYRMLFSAMKNQGVKVVGSPDDLFEDSRGEADILIGGIVTDVAINVYHDSFIEDFTKGKSNATVTIEWQVYDAFERKVMYRKTAQGGANTTFTNRQKLKGFYEASVNSLMQLLADRQFQSLILEEGGAAPEKRTETVEKGSYSVAGGGEGRSLENVKQSVVTVVLAGGHGSGFVVQNGLVITNQHVVGGATNVAVLAHDGKKYKGTVLARNARRDVAAIEVPGLSLPVLKVRTGKLAVGEDIFAIGSPKDIRLAGTVTKGIVSGMRPLKGEIWIQGDAAINGGNSGGPVVDKQGRVVGISTLGWKDAQGLYFYAPIQEALETLGLQGR